MRKSRAKKRILLPDPKFGNVEVTRFVNNLMIDGKKSIAFKVTQLVPKMPCLVIVSIFVT